MRTFKKSTSYPKEFLQIKFVHFCSFLLSFCLHLHKLCVQYILTISWLSKDYITLFHKVTLQFLRSFQMNSSSASVSWSFVDCGTAMALVCYATWIERSIQTWTEVCGQQLATPTSQWLWEGVLLCWELRNSEFSLSCFLFYKPCFLMSCE